MAKTDKISNKRTSKNQNKKEGGKVKSKDGRVQKREGGKKTVKKDEKKEKEYKPGMSYLYDPCPHRVWTPKPGERDKSEPRGAGSPWYEPVRKKEVVDKEEAEKSKKKDEKAQKKRQQAYDERQKQKEEKKKKEEKEEKKKAEQEKKKEEEKKKKEKEKKKRSDNKRKKQAERRQKEKERKEKEEKENKGKDKEKEKEKPLASYMYEPCPHKVYTPGPGEKDMADPRGVGAPWYVPVRKKDDIDKEEEEKREKEKEKIKENIKKRQQKKKEDEKREAEDRIKEEERMEKEEVIIQARIERRRKEMERRREEKEREEMEHEEMGSGVRKDKTDFTSELIFIMDFMRDVDDKERESHGEALRWKKEVIEGEIKSQLAKVAYTNDFKELISTFIEAEWGRADTILRKMEKEEKRKRKKLLENMDPLAKDLMREGKRYKTLYNAAMGKKKNGSGEGPSAMEDMLVSMIMQEMDILDQPRLDIFGRM